MNKAAQKRLLDAMENDDLDAARQALGQGADPSVAAGKLAVPAFFLAVRQRHMAQPQAFLQLFLDHGLDPNLRNPAGFGRPLRVNLGTPLLAALLFHEHSATPFDTLSAGDAMVLRLLDAGADPLAGETSELRRNAWDLAAYNQRLKVLEALDHYLPAGWTPSHEREHPLYHAFDRITAKPEAVEAVATFLLQRFPDAFDHPFLGTTLVMRMQQGDGMARGVAWAVMHGASPRGVWHDASSAYFEPDERPVLPAGRAFSAWASVVQVAKEDGLDAPFVRWALQNPAMLALINEPLWLRDVHRYARDDGRVTPLSYALHAETMVPLYGAEEQHRWKQLVQALVAAGARPDHEVMPDAFTPGQRWAANRFLDGGDLLDRYPAWEAPHPLTGRTPLFETPHADGAAYWTGRGHRLDQPDLNGDQAFTTLVARAVTGNDPALAGWCAQQLAQGLAPRHGTARGRTLGDWVGGRSDLLKAYAPHGPTEVGSLALHAAAEKLNLTVLVKLLGADGTGVARPDVNVRDADGLTPLMRLMLARVTTRNQVHKRNDAIERLVQAGAVADPVATVSFDVAPALATPARLDRVACLGRPMTVTGSALHLLAVRAIDGEESLGTLARYRAVRMLLNAPGGLSRDAWSARCSELVAQVLLDVPEDGVTLSQHDKLNAPPPLAKAWTALGLDRMTDPAVLNDLTMALLDPRRVLSHEGGVNGYAQGLSRRFSGPMFDARVQRLVAQGADPFGMALDGRTPQDAMLEWDGGVHEAVRPSRYNLQPLKPVEVYAPYREHLVAVWKRWVDVAHETRDLKAVWADAQPESDPLLRARRRL